MIYICEKPIILTVKIYIALLIVPVYLSRGQIPGGNGIRLVGGQYDLKGRVEIYQQGKWVTVCSDEWHDTHASIACRQLGLSYDGTTTFVAEHGEEEGNVVVNCTGHEERLQECTITTLNNISCYAGKSAGVICNSVQLVISPLNRRVELYDSEIERWVPICADDWNDVDASVVCHQLGLGDYGRAKTGKGNNTNGLNNVVCHGSERYLDECVNDWDSTCTNGNSVDVDCSGENPCIIHPCLNGGACIVHLHGYSCICIDGYTGIICESETPCTSNPCLNGGACIAQLHRYICMCNNGYEGIHCENKTSCTSNTCLHGGTCNEGPNGTSCVCVDGFEGNNCGLTTAQSITEILLLIIPFVGLLVFSILAFVFIYCKLIKISRRIDSKQQSRPV